MVSLVVIVVFSLRLSCGRIVDGVGLCDIDGVLLDGTLLAESEGCNSSSRREETRRGLTLEDDGRLAGP